METPKQAQVRINAVAINYQSITKDHFFYIATAVINHNQIHLESNHIHSDQSVTVVSTQRITNDLPPTYQEVIEVHQHPPSYDSANLT